jgi:hypothetical protein
MGQMALSLSVHKREFSFYREEYMANHIKTVKEHKNSNDNGVITLSTGIKAKFVAVPVWLIEEALVAIKDPPVPVQEIEGKKHPVPNPNHPDYVKGLKEAETRRASAALDVLVLFGVELIDGLPDNDLWLRKLQFLAKRGQLNLDGYDLEDELEREFVYKKLIAMGNSDWPELAKLNGVTQEDVERAKELFRS